MSHTHHNNVPQTPLPQHPQLSGLLLSFDHDQLVELDSEMPPAGAASQHTDPFPFEPLTHLITLANLPGGPTPVLSPRTARELRDLFAAGQVQSRATVVRTWELECPMCGSWINSSISTVRVLSEPGHFKTLEQHMTGKRCKPKQPSSAPSSHAPSFSISISHSPSFSPESPAASLPPWSPAPISPPWTPGIASPQLGTSYSFVYGDSPETRPRFSSAPPELQPGYTPQDMDVDRPGFGGACAGLELEWPAEL
ncbi:hypothetical protein B0H14DRAFT_3512293 [Mycena olivaceomarginata]|nr:hypothetical protein B0H14DRAFT_3512293 [Mycena olivaceomarginata]